VAGKIREQHAPRGGIIPMLNTDDEHLLTLGSPDSYQLFGIVVGLHFSGHFDPPA
jgi:hypothetical protein